jgi:chorismate mutase/prephenate dehydratase
MAKKVGYLGRDASTFGYIAMQRYFQSRSIEIEPKGFDSHTEVCERVGRMDVDYGIVAIENVLDGIVPETARAVEKVDSHLGLKILGEIFLPIQLYLANKTGDGNDIKKVISHPSALGQCNFYLSKLESRGVIIESRNSTGVAAEEAVLNSDLAALVSSEVANECGLKLVSESIVTNHENSATRFWVLGKGHALRTGDDKTCFLVNLEQSQPGSLHQTLGVFAQEKINVLLVYPISIFGKRWEYVFLIEVSGHIDDESIDSAWLKFNKLGISLRSMQFLGSYPNGTKV